MSKFKGKTKWLYLTYIKRKSFCLLISQAFRVNTDSSRISSLKVKWIANKQNLAPLLQTEYRAIVFFFKFLPSSIICKRWRRFLLAVVFLCFFFFFYLISCLNCSPNIYFLLVAQISLTSLIWGLYIPFANYFSFLLGFLHCCKQLVLRCFCLLSLIFYYFSNIRVQYNIYLGQFWSESKVN